MYRTQGKPDVSASTESDDFIGSRYNISIEEQNECMTGEGIKWIHHLLRGTSTTVQNMTLLDTHMIQITQHPHYLTNTPVVGVVKQKMKHIN